MLPKDDDTITNADESKKLPDENPEPLVETKKDETELHIEEETEEKAAEKPGKDDKKS